MAIIGTVISTVIGGLTHYFIARGNLSLEELKISLEQANINMTNVYNSNSKIVWQEFNSQYEQLLSDVENELWQRNCDLARLNELRSRFLDLVHGFKT